MHERPTQKKYSRLYCAYDSFPHISAMPSAIEDVFFNFRLTCPINVLFGRFIIPVYSNSYPETAQLAFVVAPVVVHFDEQLQENLLAEELLHVSRAARPV